MGKFKIGDRVRFTRDNPNGGAAYGAKDEVVTVAREVRNSHTYGDQVAITHPGHSWTPDAPVSALELVLTIEAGKFYKTRDGKKVGPIARNGHGDTFWKATDFTLDGYGSFWCENGRFYSYREFRHDLIAEWVDEPAVAVAASNDNESTLGDILAAALAKPKFTVGDRVDVTGNQPGLVSKVGKSGVVVSSDKLGYYVELDDGGQFSFIDSELTLAKPAAPTNPAIVALIENGQPRPSVKPYVHVDEASASKEAARLAGEHKGQSFGVYVLTQTVKEEVVYTYKHEWQRLAANGDKIPAIKALREITGLGLKATKDVVEHWIANDQQYSRVAA